MDLFIEDGAYTTVASACAMLVVLSLLFSVVFGDMERISGGRCPGWCRRDRVGPERTL